MNHDYLLFLEELGLTEAQMRDARIGIDYDAGAIDAFIELRESRIEGYGAFSLKCYALGEVIADGMKGKRWTSIGRYTNHSSTPNMRAEKTNNGFCFVAERAIRENEELTVNYRTVKAALTEKEGA